MTSLFSNFAPVKFEGASTQNPLAYRHYNPDEMILGKSMRDHLRLAVSYWHTFCGAGADMFGSGTSLRPWHTENDAMKAATHKAESAIDFVRLLNLPFYCLKLYLSEFCIITVKLLF